VLNRITASNKVAVSVNILFITVQFKI
jgi:hypothetical protein